MKQLFKTKFSKNSVKDLNESQGIVTIKITDFGKWDSDNDRMMKGALNKTWSEGKQYHLVNHDMSTKSLVGMPLKRYAEDGIVESKLNLNKQIARDLFEDYKFAMSNGDSLQHSHGFTPIKYTENEKGGFDFTEIKQREYSTVLFGAVETTPLLGIKSENDLLEQIEMFELKLSKFNYSDEYCSKIEQKLNNLLRILKEPSEDTLKDVLKDEPSQNTQSLNQFFNHLKL